MGQPLHLALGGGASTSSWNLETTKSGPHGVEHSCHLGNLVTKQIPISLLKPWIIKPGEQPQTFMGREHPR